MENKKIVLMTTRQEFTYEDYKSYCEEMSTEPIASENSNRFYEWCEEMSQIYLEDDWANLEYEAINKGRFFVEGTLGLWDGKHSVHSNKAYNSLVEAIRSTIWDSIIDYEVELENGVVNVYAYHHDGCNAFTIHLLSKKGEEAIERCLYWDKDIEPKDYWFKQIHW